VSGDGFERRFPQYLQGWGGALNELGGGIRLRSSSLLPNPEKNLHNGSGVTATRDFLSLNTGMPSCLSPTELGWCEANKTKLLSREAVAFT